MKIDLTLDEIRYLMNCMICFDDHICNIDNHLYALLEEQLKYEGGYKDED